MMIRKAEYLVNSQCSKVGVHKNQDIKYVYIICILTVDAIGRVLCRLSPLEAGLVACKRIVQVS